MTRSPHPEDRRATIVSITPASEAALATMRAGYEGLAHDLLAGIDHDDLAKCQSVLGLIRARLDDVVAARMAEAPPAKPPAKPRA